jgi:hypothetical protein
MVSPTLRTGTAYTKMKRDFIYSFGVVLLIKMDSGGARDTPIFATAILGK